MNSNVYTDDAQIINGKIFAKTDFKETTAKKSHSLQILTELIALSEGGGAMEYFVQMGIKDVQMIAVERYINKEVIYCMQENKQVA